MSLSFLNASFNFWLRVLLKLNNCSCQWFRVSKLIECVCGCWNWKEWFNTEEQVAGFLLLLVLFFSLITFFVCLFLFCCCGCCFDSFRRFSVAFLNDIVVVVVCCWLYGWGDNPDSGFVMLLLFCVSGNSYLHFMDWDLWSPSSDIGF